jgi:hypothetical protein
MVLRPEIIIAWRAFCPFFCARKLLRDVVSIGVLYNIALYVYVVSRRNIYRNKSRIIYTMSATMSAPTKTSIVIISKSGSLSECVVETNTETTIGELTILLSKKCGFRNPDGFSCYHTWRYRNKHRHPFTIAGNSIATEIPKYIYVDIWAKTDGRAGQENKYELPPPIDELLIFGNMALVARIDKENAIHLTIELWNKIYESLFGGFEDLASTAAEDENEVDELDSVPACKKTSSGYLKDGFVVEDDSEDTPRCSNKRNARGRGKKSKARSESTESEFITETDTLSSDSPRTDSDTDSEPIKHAMITPVVAVAAAATKPKRAAAIKKPVGTKSKKTVEAEAAIKQDSESELSEDSYS